METNKCITGCYTELQYKDKDFFVFHPFLGLYDVKDLTQQYCASSSYDNNLLKKCNDDDNYDISVYNALTNPIKINNYLKYYYNIKSIDEFIEYIKNNNLIFSTLSRIFDFAFITYYSSIDKSIDKWIIILTIIFPDNNITDIIASKVIKKIKSKFNQSSKYPLNLLLKIKKYLDNII
jgi:hypothetical protein